MFHVDVQVGMDIVVNVGMDVDIDVDVDDACRGWRQRCEDNMSDAIWCMIIREDKEKTEERRNVCKFLLIVECIGLTIEFKVLAAVSICPCSLPYRTCRKLFVLVVVMGRHCELLVHLSVVAEGVLQGDLTHRQILSSRSSRVGAGVHA